MVRRPEDTPLDLERFLPYRLSVLSNRVSALIGKLYSGPAARPRTPGSAGCATRSPAGAGDRVLNLLKDLQDEFGLSYVFISHDLAVVRFISDEVLVMKDGVVVEQASAQEILAHPKQEYTQRLLAAIPRGYRAAA